MAEDDWQPVPQDDWQPVGADPQRAATNSMLGGNPFIDNLTGISAAKTVMRAMEGAREAVGSLFSGHYGWTDAQLGPLVNQTDEDAAGPLALVRTFNKVVLEGGSGAVDVGMRAMTAPIVGGAAAIRETAKQLGMEPAWANRLERDTLAAATAIFTSLGLTPAGLSEFRAEARDEIVKAADKLPEGQQAEGARRMAAALDDGMTAATRDAGDASALPPPPTEPPAQGVPPPGEEPPPLTEPRIVQPLQKNVVDAASELLTAGGVQRAPGRLLSDQIMELLQTKRLTTDQIGAVLEKHGLTPDDFAELWRVNIRKAAQDMQSLSAVEQRLKALNKQPGAEDDLAAMQETDGFGSDERTLNWWQRVDNVRRGLLVTQLSTAMRNFETQVGRVGLDTMQQGMDAGLRKLFTPEGVQEAHPTDAFGAVLNTFWRPRQTQEQVDAVLSAFPKEQDRLLGNWMSEFNTGMFGKVETGVRVLNIANRFQEYLIRRAVFQSRLAMEVAARGGSLDDIVARNAVGEIPREAVQNAVDGALEMTFGQSFNPFASGPEGIAGMVIRLVNKLPGATLVLPFPRFLMNAIKFQYEWSPLGYLRLLSPSQRAAIAGGDMSAISRATIGTGLLLAAYQFRKSQYAGEKWYEIKLPSGKIIDARPFNPFASYLFLADIAKRRMDGTLKQLTAKDVASGVLSTQMRAGTGAYVLDSLLGQVAGLDMSDKAWRAIQDLAGNYLSGFAVPFHMVTDFLSDFDTSQRVIRSGEEGPTLGPVNFGPVIRGLPEVKDTLPAAHSPLREGPLMGGSGSLRQLTGLSESPPKNPVEAEVDRLGITRNEYFPSSGEPMADRLVATKMGQVVERALPQLVQSPGYKALPTPVQTFVLLRALNEARTTAKNEVAQEEPALAALLRMEGMPGRKKDAINALTNGSVDSAIELLRGAEQAEK